MDGKRIEAFSDGFLAIIITIMILEFDIPKGDTFESLKQMIPHIVVYTLSFFVIAILWNNHHHLLKLVKKANNMILWKNHLLLFSISMIPFATGWLGESDFEGDTVATEW